MVSYCRGKMLFALLLVVVFAGGLVAQDEQDLAQYDVKVNRFFDYIYVTDGDGNFVTGLTPADFTVKVNGDVVKIEELLEVNAALRDSVEWRRALEQAGGDVESEVIQEKFPPKHIVMVFDLFNSGPTSNRYARRTAKALLDQLLPTDLVSVFTYNYFLEELTPHQPVSPDEARKHIDDLPRVGSNPDYTPSPLFFNNLLEEGTDALEVERKRNFYRNFLQSLSSIAEGIAHQTMAKRMVVFSEGPDLFVYQSEEDDMPIDNRDLQRVESDAAEESPLNEEMMDAEEGLPIHANQASSMTAQMEIRNAVKNFERFLAGTGTEIYTVRRGRLMPEWVGSVEYDISDRFDRRAPNAAVMMDVHENRINNLRRVAEMTGGKFYASGIPQSDFVSRFINDVGNYYQIIFTVPLDIEEAGYNKIEITHSNPEYTVKHKPGFFGFATREYMAKRANMKVGRVKSEMAYQTPLELQSKFYLFPFPEASAALLSVEMDAGKVKLGDDDTADLQVKMMTWDKFGNPVDELTREISQKVNEKGKLQFHMLTPVSGTVETVELRVEDKNSDAGGFIQKRMGMKVSGETTIIATEPMLIRDTGASFATTGLEDGRDSLVQRLTSDLMGSPLTERVVEQGEDLKIVMFFTDSARDFEEIPEGIRTAFAVRPSDGEVFALIPRQEDISLVEGTNIIRYVTDLPLGYAPMESGRLEIYVGGLEESGPLMLQLPFTIENYDQGRAEEYIKSQVKVQKVRQ